MAQKKGALGQRAEEMVCEGIARARALPEGSEGQQWVVASAYRIATMYVEFGRALDVIELPPGLIALQEAEYRSVILDKALPLFGKAQQAFGQCQRLYDELGVGGSWAERCIQDEEALSREVAAMKAKLEALKEQVSEAEGG